MIQVRFNQCESFKGILKIDLHQTLRFEICGLYTLYSTKPKPLTFFGCLKLNMLKQDPIPQISLQGLKLPGLRRGIDPSLNRRNSYNVEVETENQL